MSCDSCGYDEYECNCEDCPRCGERITPHDYDIANRTAFYQCSCGHEWEGEL